MKKNKKKKYFCRWCGCKINHKTTEHFYREELKNKP